MRLPVLLDIHWFPLPALGVWAARTHGNAEAHTHDFVEIVLVTGGSARTTIFTPDGHEHTRLELAENQLFLLRPGWGHTYEHSDSFEIFNLMFALELLNVAWPVSQCQSQSQSKAQNTSPLTLGRGEVVPCLPAEREHLEACMRTIMQEVVARAPGFEVMARARLMEFLILAQRIEQARQHGLGSLLAPAESSPAVTRAIAFMEKNLAEDITLEAMARAAHLSPHYFCEVFKLTTGLSPGRYLTHLRLEHAKVLLTNRNLSIGEVALQSGFKDGSYFARVFKKVLGSPPRSFHYTGRLS